MGKLCCTLGEALLRYDGVRAAHMARAGLKVCFMSGLGVGPALYGFAALGHNLFERAPPVQFCF